MNYCVFICAIAISTLAGGHMPFTGGAAMNKLISNSSAASIYSITPSKKVPLNAKKTVTPEKKQEKQVSKPKQRNRVKVRMIYSA